MQFGWAKKRRKITGSKQFESVDDADAEGSARPAQPLALCSAAPYIPTEEARAHASKLKEEGNARAEAGAYREALRAWSAAVELTPEEAVLHELQAQAHLELDDLWAALRCATRATTLAPDWPEGFVTRGRAELSYGEPELAVVSLQRALVLDAANDDAIEELDNARALCMQRQKLKEQGENVDGLRFTVSVRSCDDPLPFK